MPDLRGAFCVMGHPEALSLMEPKWRKRLEPMKGLPLSEVIEDETFHPAVLRVCDSCGEISRCLERCGCVLCIPCWRKRAGRTFMEILMTVQHHAKVVRPFNRHPYVRFVTLTIRNMASLADMVRVLEASRARLFRREWWKRRTSGAICKLEVTWNGRTDEWHAHVHVLQFGDYLPEEELEREWGVATHGAGCVAFVKATSLDCRKGSLGLAAELSKYAAKPVSESDGPEKLPLSMWPEARREELGGLMAGGVRTRYWCGQHRARSWRVCARDWVKRRIKCNGSFRIERTGRQIVRYSGKARQWHREARAARRGEDLTFRCAKCGKGRLRVPEAITGEQGGLLHLSPEQLSDLIREHDSTDGGVIDAILKRVQDQGDGPPGWEA